jgi:hypothetical protein
MALIIFFCFPVWGCEIFGVQNFYLATSTQDNRFFAYGTSELSSDIPEIKIQNCERVASSKKYLMLGFGPQNQEFTDRISAYDISQSYRDSGCTIANSPFKKTLSFSDRKEYLDKKWHAIKSCYSIEVEETADAELKTPNTQPGCQVNRINPKKISFNGGFCFIRPSANSSLSVKFNINEKCLSYPGLNDLNVKVTDLQTMLGVYIAGDATGTSVDLTSLRSMPTRLSVSPNEKLIPTSEIYSDQTPQFPSSFHAPDIHLGIPEAKELISDFIQFRIPFWVHNSCKENCQSGFCQSVCDYTQPIVGNVDLYELKDQNILNFIGSWIQGGIAQPQYQGEITGPSFEIAKENLSPGKIYKAVIHFNDPKFDFELLKKRIKSKVRKIDQTLGTINGGQIPALPDIPHIDETEIIPTYLPYSGINFDSRIRDNYRRAIQTFNNVLNFKFWPPYFEKICSDDACQGVKNDYLKFEIEFSLTKFDPVLKTYSVDIFRVSRKSDILSGYDIQMPKMPEVVCPF